MDHEFIKKKKINFFLRILIERQYSIFRKIIISFLLKKN